ncbi:MAG: MFS transporter, partial [Desulfovibrionales bacterium]|nr:MFS transporter [Desulfovibrionales bacterium]
RGKTKMDGQKDQYFKRNATGIALVEFFWGLGFPVVMESTFLQIFLKNLGASDLLIGLVPSIMMGGISICPLISSFLIRHQSRTRGIVLGFHLLSSGVILSFGAILFTLSDPRAIIPVFFGAYVLYSMSIGLTFPIWLNYLVKIFSPQKNVKGLAIMYMAQNTAKIIVSLIILHMVNRHAFSQASSAWIFLGAGLVFLVGSFGFLITREIPEKTKAPSPRATDIFSHIADTSREILNNPSLVRYLLGDLDTYVVITTISFYANYATGFFGVSQAVAAGLFVTLLYSGAILANGTMGTLNWFSLRQKYLSTKLLTLLALGLLMGIPCLASFLLVSLILGFCRGTRNIIYSPLVKRFARREDATAIFAVAPLLTIWFTAGFPLFFGGGLDRITGREGYEAMFGIALVLTLCILWIGCQVDFNDNPGIALTNKGSETS